ncbi:retron St85 family effector protein [Anaerovorax odorimutans]|uniref:retron St85 family effector protein n=1 Tax=Anaerovorax odorimutans TaxID=109327 RepID=UPI000413D532|nr:retron St85 family effector protein [Anaerovorax odorimutans]
MEVIVQEIYEKVFMNLKHSNLDIFLCGGASTKTKKSYRDKLREILDNKEDLSILYPEDMFMEILNRKKSDLLTLEKFLANNSDVLIIVCESPGSFVELGAFVNNSETFPKVVVLLNFKYKNVKSFIRQGPVEYVRKNNKNNIIFYNTDIDATIKELDKCIDRKFGSTWYRKKNAKTKDLHLISGQYNFIIILLFFLQELDIKSVVSNIKKLYENKGYIIDDFEFTYTSAVRRLFKDGFIKKENGNYSLTEKGYFYSYKLLSEVNLKNRSHIFDSIRISVLHKLYY